jgi:amidase
MGAMARQNPDKFKPELLDNIEAGFNLSADDLIKAELARGRIYNAMATFFQKYDLLLSPSTIVPPFPVEQRYVESCDGHQFEKYVDWLGIAFPATLASCPSISIPAGLTENGLPVGLQMIGHQKGEALLLSAAQTLEDQIGASPLPIDPQSIA